MKTIYLMRHGEYGDEPKPFSLTETGIGQIIDSGKQIKEELAGIEEIKIYSSPILRARESAETLQQTLYPIKSEIETSRYLGYEEEGMGEGDIEWFLYQLDEDITTAVLISHYPPLMDYLGWSNPDLNAGEFSKKII